METKLSFNKGTINEGTMTIQHGYNSVVIPFEDQYDKEDIGHHLINGLFDLFQDRDEAVTFLALYLDEDDKKLI